MATNTTINQPANRPTFNTHGGFTTFTTVSSIVGLIGTCVLIHKKSKEAHKKLDEAEEKKGEKLTVWEKVKVVAPVYALPMATGGLTITAIIAGQSVNRSAIAGLAGTAAVLSTRVDKISKWLNTEVGETVKKECIEKQVKEDIVKIERIEDDIQVVPAEISPYTVYHMGATTTYLNTPWDNEEEANELFYDVYSNTYFYSTKTKVLLAESLLDRDFMQNCGISLTNWYDLLYIKPTNFETAECAMMGWTYDDTDGHPLDFLNYVIENDDGLKVNAIEFTYEPRVLSDDEY